MTFTSLGSNFGAECEDSVSRQVDDTREDDTYAWRVRKVVSLLEVDDEGEVERLNILVA
jgi:hypothetical protein